MITFVYIIIISSDPSDKDQESPTEDIRRKLPRSLQFELLRITQQPPDKATGIVYICDVQHDPQRRSNTKIIKIGVTSDLNRRLKHHIHSCVWTRLQLLTFYPRWESETDNRKQIRSRYQVEKLIHTELGKFKYNKKCGCGKTHKELFEIHKDELENMLATVKHWVSWSEQKFGHALVPRGG